MDSLEALNRKIFLLINADDNTAAWLLCLGKFLAKDTLYLLVLLLACLWLWGGDARRRLTLKAIVTAAAALVLGTLAGMIWVHQRPFALGIGHTYIPHIPNASFPSHHTAIFAAVGFTLLAAETRTYGWAVLGVGIAMAWARIFMGVHFPLDMVGAVVMAAAAYFGVSKVWNKYAACVESCLVHVYRKIFAPLISRGWVRP